MSKIRFSCPKIKWPRKRFNNKNNSNNKNNNNKNNNNNHNNNKNNKKSKKNKNKNKKKEICTFSSFDFPRKIYNCLITVGSAQIHPRPKIKKTPPTKITPFSNTYT